MSYRLTALRIAAAAITAVGWAAACGTGDSVTITTPECSIYFGGGVIPDPPDGAKLCPAGACNYQSQQGCPANENCFPHYDATSNTVTATCGEAGGQTAGEPCDSANQLCARGLVCADGACQKSCCGGDYTACAKGESCIRQAVAFKTASGDVISYDEGLGTCAPVGGCKLLDSATTCASDPKRPVCRIVDPTGAVACSPSGDRDVGEACDTDHQCGVGQHCAGNANAEAGAGVPTTCVRLCGFGSCNATPACPAKEGVCVHFTRDPAGVGECTLNWTGPGLGVPVDGGVLDASAAAHD
ncbi:MAG TPA: hypothetical protein VH062_05855 [Polyangiaceae bacterium]|jgi:hypothetical protein|nr:hypothetical protein [Polyangiaceae bacterium]